MCGRSQRRNGHNRPCEPLENEWHDRSGRYGRKFPVPICTGRNRLERQVISAAIALNTARTAGVAVRLDGDDLVLEAAAEPPAAILELLSRYKPAVVALLQPGEDRWSAENWRVIFDERAGIAEFDGGLSRAAAEASAFTDCVAEWLNRNPMRSPPGRCFGCGDTGPRTTPSSPSVLEVRARPSCIRAAPPLGTPGGRPKRSLRWRRWGSDRQPTF